MLKAFFAIRCAIPLRSLICIQGRHPGSPSPPHFSKPGHIGDGDHLDPLVRSGKISNKFNNNCALTGRDFSGDASKIAI